MGLRNQDWGSPETIRSAAILTNSYVAGTDITDLQLFNQIVLYVDFTLGSLTTAEIKVEFSANGTDFYQETFQAVTAGTAVETVGEHQVNATGAFRLLIPVKDKIMRVSAKGTGTVTGSSMTIQSMRGII